jgi:S1-C subfamily serine protease
LIRRLLPAFVLGLVLGAVVFQFRGRSRGTGDAGVAASPRSADIEFAAPVTDVEDSPIVRAVRRVSDSVVSIGVKRKVSYGPPAPADIRDLFSRTFSRLVPDLGSGVLVDASGVIITNAHVIRDAAELSVRLSDGRYFDVRAGKVHTIGEDPRYDLAVLKIEDGDERFEAAPIGDSENLTVGEWVIAIGNPFAFYLSDPRPSVSVGVVSALNREVLTDESKGGIYKNMIQTDAAINSGNSGGALVNARGEVVGINTFLLSTSGGNIGLGFAIPIHVAERVMKDFIEHGRVREVWVGIQAYEITPFAMRELDLTDPNGIVVGEVDPASPAGRAGVRQYDVIRGVNGRRIRSFLEANRAIFGSAVGDLLILEVERGDELMEISFVLEELPTKAGESPVR